MLFLRKISQKYPVKLNNQAFFAILHLIFSSATDFRNTITTVFNKLSGKEKFCKVLVDEIMWNLPWDIKETIS